MKRHQDWNAEIATDIIATHREREGALLPILHDLQETFGYIPDDAKPLLAKALNLSRADVHGVVTFYHDFRDAPAGRHVLKLCQAEACQSCGSDVLTARAESALGIKLGETSPDGRITLEPVYCLGLCATAPSAMIDGRVVGRLTDKKLAALLNEADR
jgi:formate dehydrogenase subunit gamma